MRRIVIASDSFKGSADSMEIASAIEAGVNKTYPNVQISKFAIADGGEGTVQALVDSLGGEFHTLKVTGPLGKQVKASFGLLDKETAIIEVAEASGLVLAGDQKNPFKATSFGTGELIKAALDMGVSKLYIGMGGSATNDGGVGLAQALGVSFKDSKGEELSYGAESLKDLQAIDMSGLDPRINEVEIVALSDVSNPLTGQNGASFVYAEQKGAKKSELNKLDSYLKNLENLIGKEISQIPGAGAAGGIGAGLKAFLNAELKPGIETILQILEIDDYIKEADLVITGEGKIDNQSLYGKVPVGVARLAKKYGKRVIGIVGSSPNDHAQIHEMGIDLVIETVNKPMELNEAMKDWKELVTLAGMKVGCLMKMLDDESL